MWQIVGVGQSVVAAIWYVGNQGVASAVFASAKLIERNND